MAKQKTVVRQQQIIDAALTLIRDGGLANLTIKKIAAKVRISEQAIYRHFENKRSILDAIIQHFNQTLGTRLHNQAKFDDLFQMLHTTIHTHLKFFRDFPEMAALVYTEEIFKMEPHIFSQIQETISKRIQTISEMLEKGQKEGTVSDRYKADNLALIIFGAIRALVSNWRFSDFGFNLTERGLSLTEDMLNMIKP